MKDILVYIISILLKSIYTPVGSYMQPAGNFAAGKFWNSENGKRPKAANFLAARFSKNGICCMQQTTAADNCLQEKLKLFESP